MKSFTIHSRSALHFAVLALFVFVQFNLSQPLVVQAAPALVPVPQPQRPASLSAPGAGVTLNVPTNVILGQDVAFSVSFKNTGDTGYGPFIDLIIPATGEDGKPGCPGGAIPFDGLGTTKIDATYLGSAIAPQDFFVTSFDCSGNATHPLAKDTSGNLITVSGNPGDKLVTIRLPFGSFTPTQPAAEVKVTVNMSDLADVNFPLNIQARGGFQFGATPLDDWCCDSVVATITPWVSASVTPILYTITKTYNGPEDETATGPNFPRSYTITVDIANGQPLTNLVVTDVLPNNIQYLSASSGPAFNSIVPPAPTTTTPGGTLRLKYDSITGTGAPNDITITVNFFVPLVDNSSPTPLNVVDPVAGAAGQSINSATGHADWLPKNTSDRVPPNPPGTIPVDSICGTPCTHTLNDRSIAIQKGATVVSAGGPKAGATVQYTLNIQVSDFFAFAGVNVNDIISDGQRFDTSFTPTMEVHGNGINESAASISVSNYTLNCYYTGAASPPCTTVNPPQPMPPAADITRWGTTWVGFDISGEMNTRGDGVRLLGGCVNPAGGLVSPCDPAHLGTGPTTVTIIFHTVIQNDFSDNHPPLDTIVDQGDIINDNVTVSGNVLDTSTFTTTGTATDDSAAQVTIPTGTLSKEIYAVDGAAPGNPVLIKPGDQVTYRIQYDLPTSDEESMEFKDYLPLPIFSVDDPNATGGSGWSWVFDTPAGTPPSATIDGSVPASGHGKFGPADTFYNYSGQATSTPSTPMVPVITDDKPNNILDFNYGDFSDTRHQGTHVDLLFTVTVSSAPFADKLYLTNQVRGREGSAPETVTNADAIVQLVLTEPVLVHKKGVVATDNPHATFSPATVGPVAFNAPGTAGPRWGGTVDSPGLATHPIDSNISGVDAGDLVTFAIVIENQGSSANGAFDITILDTLPSIYQIPAGGMNLRVANGDNSTSFNYSKPDGSDPNNPLDLYSTGIKITDPDPTHGACQASTVGAGKNILIITYDLQVRDNATPGTYENTATLTHYAGSPGGPNHVPATPPVDKASSTILTSMVKSLVGTSINDAGAHNDNTHAVIGELATYQIVITVPEGIVPAAKIVDTLDSGLAFVKCNSVVPSTADVTTSYGLGNFSDVCSPPTNPAITNTGHTATWDLGDITNTNRDNNVVETLTINYSVVILNVAGNLAGTTLNNSAVYSWTGDSMTRSAANVTVIESAITTTKAVAGAPFDAGDTATYTVTLTNTGGSGTDAFDITWSDTIDTNMTYKAGSLAFGTCPAAAKSVNDSLAPNLSASVSEILYGASCQLTYQTTINYSASPGQAIPNTAQTQWTSLQGPVSGISNYNTDSNERTGTGVPAVNDYRSQGSIDVDIRNVAAEKFVAATSETDTSGSNVAIGEVVRFRVPIVIPEGTSAALQVRDLLPPGMMFLNDNSAKIVLVSGDPAACPGSPTMTSSTIGSAPGLWVCGDTGTITPTFPLPASAISNHGTASPFGDGDDPWFDLGTINNNDSDPDQEFIVLEYNAVVLNVSGNKDGTTLNNQYEVWVNGAKNNTSSIAAVNVVESDVTLAKTNSAIAATVDAGDKITYTITIANNGANAHAPAYDSHFTDTLPADLTLIPGSVSATFSGGALGLTNNSLNNLVDFTITTIPVSGQAVVTYQATVNTSVTPQQAIMNTGTLVWTSLPGPQGTSPNTTGSTTPGNSGDTNGERNGSGVTNDYTSSATSRVTVGGITIVKKLVRTSDSDTAGSNVTIGEVITYGILFTVPEGTVASDIVVDTLPSGLSLVSGSSQIITAAASSSGLLTADYKGTFGSSITEVTTPGGSVTFSFTNIVTAGDNNVNNNTILLQYQAVVLNVVDNHDITLASPATTLTNSATNQVGSGPVSSPVTVTTNVVESKLTIAKSVTDAHPAPGEILTFTLTIKHDPASHAGAFDLAVSDPVPAGFTNINSITMTPGGGASGVTNTSSGNTVSATVDTFPLGATLTITFKATDVSPYNPAVPIDNTASVAWTSLHGADTNERTGDRTGPNNYYAESSLALTVDRNLTKNITGSTFSTTDLAHVRIGDILTYQVVLTVPANLTDTTIVVDNLPSGMAFIDCTTTPMIIAGPDITSTRPGFTFNTPGNCAGGTTPGSMPLVENSGNKVTFDFGTIHNANTTSVEMIAITYRAVVLDIAANVNNISLDNNVTWTWGKGNISASAGPVVVREAKLGIVKTVDPAIAIRGSIVNFTIKIDHSSSSTAAAYDALMTDGIPSGMTLDPTSIAVAHSAGLTAVPVITASPTQFSVYWAVFPLGENATITFSATYDGPGAVVNTANAQWSSIQIDPALHLSAFNRFSTVRHYSPLNLPVDNYFATSSVEIKGPKGLSTGFAPGRVTVLPPQPEDKAYQNLGDLWLEVPRLGVRLSIVGIPLGADDEWDLTWLGDQAGYLDGTAYPTHAGNSVITGHVYMADGTPGPFVNLHTLLYGDQIIVHLAGQRYVYQVREDKITSPDDLSAFKHEIYPWLTLITCKDYDAATNTYAHRVVVRAVLIKIEEDTPPNSGGVR